MFGHATFCDYDGQSTMFTHGGSGIVLSGGIVKASFGQDPEFEHNHDQLIQKSAFGDALLSKSIYESPKVTIHQLSPEAGQRFNSDPPRVLKFTRHNWCSPILTFHHVTPSDTAHLYHFQRKIQSRLKTQDATIRWSDIWDEFIPNFLKQSMKNLDNFDNKQQQQPTSFHSKAEGGSVSVIGWQTFEEWDDETTDIITTDAQECQNVCKQNVTCLMWEWRKGQGERDQIWQQIPKTSRKSNIQPDHITTKINWGKCRYTSHFLRIGITKPKQSNLITGWMPTRIHQWRNDQQCPSHS